MTNYFYLMSSEIGNVADNVLVATFSNSVVSMDFSAGITIRVNGTPATITSVKRMDDENIIQFTINVHIVSTDNVKLSYTALPFSGMGRSERYGDYVTSDHGTVSLETFSSVIVTNNVPDTIGDALRADAVAYWKMDEVSGDRADSKGLSTLTDNNTVASTTGKVSNAARFVRANGEYLSAGNPVPLQCDGADFYGAAWLRMQDVGHQNFIVSKVDFDLFIYEIEVYYRNDLESFRFDVDGLSFASIGLAAQANTWYFVEFYYDVSANEIGIAVNNSAFEIANPSFPQEVTAGNWIVGAYLEPGSEQYGDCDIDEFGYFKPADVATWLTADKRNYLWNSGSGRTLYP